MNQQSSSNPIQSDPANYQETRRQRIAAHRAGHGERNNWSVWLVGLLLILAGGAILLHNTGLLSIPLTNWWALFIMLPSLGAFERAWRSYRIAGNQWTRRANSALIAGLLLIVISAGFLFNLNWIILGPFLVILIGLAILINSVIFK